MSSVDPSLQSNAPAARRVVQELSEKLSHLLGRNQSALLGVNALQEQSLSQIAQKAALQKDEAGAAAQGKIEQAQQQANGALRETLNSLTEREGRFWPSLAGQISDFKGAESLCPAHQVRPLIRLGQHHMTVGQEIYKFPAFAEFLNKNHLVVDGPSSDPEVASLIQNVVSQSYLAGPAGQVIVTVFNPRMNRMLAAFQRSASTDAGIFVPVPPTREALSRTLQEHVAHLNSVQTSLGGQYSSLGEIVDKTRQHEYPYRVLVLLDTPVDWSDQALGDLERILSAGHNCGISVILHYDSTRADAELGRVKHLAQACPRVEIRANETALHARDFTGAFAPAGASSAEEQIALIDVVAKAAETGALPDVDFEPLVRMGRGSTKDGMSVTLGRQGSQDVSFVIGDTISNLQNILIGGAVGTGKSNLLKVLIYSLAASYSADELEMYLLDFKEGVEFQQFIATDTRRGLPNARLVSMESDQGFGISTLEHFNEEITRRGQLFKSVGAKSISDYRALSGEVLPRWLLVADEFQVLFDEPDGLRAAELLENLARKGRAFGLHVVLASQTLSGIRFGSGKEAAIFGQFPVRIVLKQDKQESEVFLGTGNQAAAGLMYRGQAVLNKSHGRLEANQTFIVAHAKDDYLDRLQNDLAASGPSLPTRVYKGSERTTTGILLTSAGKPQHVQGLNLWVGETAAVTSEIVSLSLERRPVNNLLVTGPDFAAAIATIQTATLSAARGAGHPLRMNFFDTVPPSQRDLVQRDEWDRALQALGVQTQWFGDDEVRQFLRVYEQPSAEADTLQVLLQPEASSFEYEAEDADWAEAAVRMPLKGVHTLGYWSSGQLIPIRRRSASDYFAHQIFHAAPADLISDATKINPSRLPTLLPTLAGLYSGQQSSTALHVFRPVENLTADDFKKWTQS